MIDGRNFFDQPVKNNLTIMIVFEKLQDDCTNGRLLDYNYLKDHMKMKSVLDNS